MEQSILSDFVSSSGNFAASGYKPSIIVAPLNTTQNFAFSSTSFELLVS